MMTREELREAIKGEWAEIITLFNRKNEAYGNKDDAFYNFRATAKRLYWDNDSPNSMFRVLMTYVDKHMVALSQHGLATPEAEERMRDIVVYMLIGIAMVREVRRGAAWEHMAKKEA